MRDAASHGAIHAANPSMEEKLGEYRNTGECVSRRPKEPR
jgi:hypothetical protein